MDNGFFGAISGLKITSLKQKIDDDGIDRLNSKITPILIVIFAVILSGKTWVGEPMQCWVPAEFTEQWEKYTENYCWVKNTYFVPPPESIPHYIPDRKEAELGYYQWVPFVLLIMALLFYLPRLVWGIFNWQTGINITTLVKGASDAVHSDPKSRSDVVKNLSALMRDSMMKSREARFNWAVKLRRFASYCVCCCGRRQGNYLTNLYIFHKILYCTNVIGQFYLLNSFLGTSYQFYGWEIARDLALGKEWPESGHFPRVTMCDFEIRTLANVQRHTVQCVLMINLFNEKIFIFLWFWFLLVAIVTTISLASWMFRMLLGFSRESFVRRYLELGDHFDPGKRDVFRAFLNDMLRPDGVFLLRLISQNSGDIITCDLINHMWENYLNRSNPKLQEDDGEDEDPDSQNEKPTFV